ncbi:MAG: sulfatase-like hydrolase/transferase [Acidobacteria bacterium]|nr:sulfatase-like hydrolase/transferase [Acidobacteriota bacterium]
MTRRQALRSFAVAPFVQTAKRTRGPNLLFLIADDHAGYVFGADGNRLARTPHLDRLATQGIRFARNYCNSPVCTPSRQSILTGQMPHAAGVTRLPTPLSPDKPTIAKQLKRAGYTTAVLGKMHWNRPAEPGLHGFHEAFADQAGYKLHQEQVQPRPVPDDIKTKPPWRPFKDPARIWLNADRLPYPRYHADMRGAFVARWGLDYLKQHRNHPFALWLSFNEPHSPFDFPVEDRERFDPAGFSAPRVGPEDPPQIPLIFRDLTEDEKRGIAAAYYTSVGFLDRNVGSVLEGLKQLGLEENTLVVYMADHGYNLGHHGRFEKHCCYDPAMRVPLLMRYPAGFRGGRTVEAFTESVDVPSTILGILGAPPLPVNHGRSLVPLLRGEARVHRDLIFTEYLENEEAAVRTAEWKFIFCSGRRERVDGYKTDHPTPGRYRRLYNLRSDPGEFTDLAGKKEYAAVVERLERALLQRFLDTHPEAPPAGLDVSQQLEWFLRPRDA